MRIIVLSDTHGDARNFEKVLLRHQEEAGLFLHLGDGAAECKRFLALYPGLPLEYVCGNCDYFCGVPEERVLRREEINILFAHGHTLHVKSGLEELIAAARRAKAGVALFGHTHIPRVVYQKGIHLMNPGSLGAPRGGRPSYGVVDLTPQGIFCHTVEL